MHGRHAGITLVEMMVVMVVLAIMFGVGIYSLREQNTRRSLEADLQNIISATSQARSSTVKTSTGNDVDFTYNAASKTLTYTRGVTGAAVSTRTTTTINNVAAFCYQSAGTCTTQGVVVKYQAPRGEMCWNQSGASTCQDRDVALKVTRGNYTFYVTIQGVFGYAALQK